MIGVNQMKLPYDYAAVSEQVLGKVKDLLNKSGPLEESNSVVLSSTVSSANLLSLRGLGKEIWQEVDAQEYVSNLRQEWNE